MTKAKLAGAALVAVIVVLALAAALLTLAQSVGPAWPPTEGPSAAAEADGTLRGYLHGRVTTVGEATYEGRLRWGGDEEAFWGDSFDGRKDENPWLAQVSPERLLKEDDPIEIFGVRIAGRERDVDFGRPFMARFGDIARVESRGADVLVTLKSGTVVELDRHSAGDFDDGVRVWDAARGVVDLGPRQIRTIELLPMSEPGTHPARLHGMVRTAQGDFTGFVEWDRRQRLGHDELGGHAADGQIRLRFDTIRSIERRSPESSLVTLLDGREVLLAGHRDVGQGNRGLYVDDQRYGRVLISWDAFERVDFQAGGSGPVYEDFPPGRPLTGSVTTSDGRRFSGRLIYDLDESETTETFDAPSGGVNYSIPFGLIASIEPEGGDDREVARAKVTLQRGEELRLEGRGDLGDGNAGMLIFVESRERPEYVLWADVERVDFDRPPAMYPPL